MRAMRSTVVISGSSSFKSIRSLTIKCSCPSGCEVEQAVNMLCGMCALSSNARAGTDGFDIAQTGLSGWLVWQQRQHGEHCELNRVRRILCQAVRILLQVCGFCEVLALAFTYPAGPACFIRIFRNSGECDFVTFVCVDNCISITM